MARFTSSAERTFVTCSAPVYIIGHLISKESKNNIVFSGFFVEQMCIIEANNVNTILKNTKAM
jgi:hypothetical protein